MDSIIFQNRINVIMIEKPKLFAFESDDKANREMIELVENYYNVLLPDIYKNFVKQYGGGYFGFIIVYSCDCNGMFYIKDKILKEWVLKKKFLPVVDFETGDFLGFEITDGICQDKIVLYSHEEDEVRELEIDFYDALLKYGFNI